MWSCEEVREVALYQIYWLSHSSPHCSANAHKLPISALVYASYEVVVPQRSMWIS